MSRLHRPAYLGSPSVSLRVSKAVTLLVICLIILVPFLIVLSTSVSTRESLDRNGGYVLIPESFTLEAYATVLNGGIVSRAVIVSLLVTLVGTGVSVVATTMVAYAISRKGTLFHGPILTFILLTFLFSPGIIPVYLMVRQLGLLDNHWSLILPVAVSAFNVVIIRGFFMSVPNEIVDSARVDGASEWRIFARIMLPLSKAVVAVVALFYAVGYWNAFFNAMLYLSDSSKWTLQLVLRTYVLQGSPLIVDSGVNTPPPAQSIQMAVIVVAMVPILCVYPFIQRHMTKGVLTGAVKG